MPGYAYALLFVQLPVFVVCGLIYLWSQSSDLPRLARVLKWSAVIWAGVLTVTLHFVVVVSLDCAGGILYGFETCSFFPQSIADLAGPLLFFSFAAGILYGVGLVLAGAIAEWRALR